MIKHEPYIKRQSVIKKTDENDYKGSAFMMFKPADSGKRDFIFQDSCVKVNSFIRRMIWKAKRSKK